MAAFGRIVPVEDLAVPFGMFGADLAVAARAPDVFARFRRIIQNVRRCRIQCSGSLSRYLMMAVNQNHLPAIHKLAEICENTTNWHNDVAAYALYRMAAREGATGFEKHLERLRARNQLYLDSELERIERWINDGIGPACY
jgi:hypothetical protein